MIDLPIGTDDIKQIVAIEDPALRNLWITQSYADFAARLRVAISAENHTWCGFAVWASGTAGQSIREQELGAIGDIIAGRPDVHIDAVNDRLQRLQRLGIMKRLERVHLLAAVRGALDSVRDRIAHGNTLVFAELAPLFVAFIEIVERGGQPDHDQVMAALDRVATEPIDDGVRAAFGWYTRAFHATDGEQAHAILAGNVLAVAHEQQRLQDDIAASLGAGLITAGDVVSELLPRWVPGFVAKALGHGARREIDRLLTDVWDATTTELLMTLRVPGATLHLNGDVPAGPGDLLFPVGLADLTDVPPDTVFQAWDRTGGTGLGCGARDWAVLAERMNYIVNLFRSRQQDPTLAAAPFTESQVAMMQRGQVPTGPLLPAS